MNLPGTAADDSAERLARLSTLARDVLARCAARGASQAEVALNEDRDSFRVHRSIMSLRALSVVYNP